MSRNVIVTGGAGSLGRHTCKALARAGYIPVTLDNLSTGHERFVRWGPFVHTDLRDQDDVEAALRATRPLAVVHFAALSNVGESVEDPVRYDENNVGGTLALLRAMTATGVDRIVFSSSCAIYGQPEMTTIDEGAPQRPISPYGQTKLVCERMIADHDAATGSRSMILRYFNAAGADAEGELGELRDRETHLIPRAMMALQGHVDDFRVLGDDYPTPDGSAVRDYVHVSDLADAHLRALEALLAGREVLAVNLGTGRGHSVRQVLDMIRQVTGRAITAPRGHRRTGDPAFLVADARRARDRLGWTPTMSDLETIVRTAWQWHQHAHPRRAAGVIAQS